MGELYELVEWSKKGDKERLLEIIYKFKPLIRKYSRKLCYDGSDSDLVICLLETIYNIPTDKVEMQKDECIAGYINISIKHKYIYLSKKYTSMLSRETELNTNIMDKNCEDIWEDYICLNNLVDKLPKLQQQIIKKIYFNGVLEKDLAKQLNISRQAVNRTKNRALKNLKNNYLS
ncbi:MAG: polymerase sigma factor, sigma-70 family [Clostridiaceae bacterium]|jgi:RNA polymerase sigma factor (sigma-70 family)|nr:polymerase sigma factor, sigma-70 family [Clostridiaceae bacterium]